MGCKQHLACYNKYIYNFASKTDTNGEVSWVDYNTPSQVDQCRPDPGAVDSVCRQCCDPDDPDFGGLACGMFRHVFFLRNFISV